ncbi:MAG: DUF3367 domain-containing protein [Acidimicrobiales bacterium]|nr:DUF3367 domain-containing protein [Acidimicrobiales bacterium]
MFLVAYIPNFVNQPGVVSADNKLYLFTDPGRFLVQSSQMWDPTNALGTVTHQHIGYLLPLAPFYWLFTTIGSPIWFTERIWTGSLLFFAGLGVYRFTRVLKLGRSTQLVASFFYMLSPYSLQYLNRISDILLTWSALGWMMAFVVLSAHKGKWRYPAAFALVVAVVGGTNGSSIIYVGIGPVAWLIYAAYFSKEIKPLKALVVALRIAVLTLAVSIWWAVALWVEAGFGLNILKFTETVPAVASTSLASEAIRGLGYWFYYGQSALGSWVPSSVGYQEHIWLILVSFAVPAIAIYSAVRIKWKMKGFFIALLFTGLVASVGTHPFSSPSIWGRAVSWFMLNTTAGFALRSTDRATPLIILSLAILLGCGMEALYAKCRSLGQLKKYKRILIAVLALLVLNLAALWDGQLIPPQYQHPETFPSYYYQAANYLDSQTNKTRVLVEPGTDTAVYRFGTTIDPILPGIMSRDSVEREQLPQGTTASVDLQDAIDQPLQEGVANPNTYGDMARLISAGDMVLQSNLAYEDYGLPEPQQTWQLFSKNPKRLSSPIPFGKPVPNVAKSNTLVLFGQQQLSLPPNAPWPAPLEVFPVPNARPIVRAESTSMPLIIDGGGSGLVNSSSAGLLAGNPTVFYSGTYAGSSKGQQQLKSLASKGADLVITDTNRKSARRWAGTIQDVQGYTETATETNNPTDYSNAPLNLFPQAGSDAQTVTELHGIASVEASAYGNQVSYEPYQRPAMALDGNTDTSWAYSLDAYSTNQWWQVSLINPVTENHITLTQVLDGTPIYSINKVTITFDGSSPITASLGAESRTPKGQTINFPMRSFTTLRITIDGVTTTGNKTGVTDVGFSEVGISGIKAVEVVRTPIDLLQTLGTASNNDRLSIVLNRWRVGPVPPRPDPEATLARDIWLPTERTFAVTGTVAINASTPDEVVDSILGRPGSNGSGMVARSSGRLPGFLDSRASMAFDGNSSTSWSPGSGLNQQIGAWVELDLPNTTSFSHLNFVVDADNHHSVPTSITLSTEQGLRFIKLPKVTSENPVGHTVSMSINFPAITGRRIRITIDSVQKFYGQDVPNQPFYVMPVGIAEVGIPGETMPPVPTNLPTSCNSNLLTVNGVPVSVELKGTTTQASSGGEIPFIGCGNSNTGVSMGPGDAIVEGNPPTNTGINLDSVTLDSAPGGGIGTIVSPGEIAPAPSPKETALGTMLNSTATSYNAKIVSNGQPFWLVLGESQDKGWSATLSNGQVLGQSTLIDGYANGWLVKPPPGKQTLYVHFYFAPQSYVWLSLILGAIFVALCLVILLFTRRSRHVSAYDAVDAPTLDDRIFFNLKLLSTKKKLGLSLAFGLAVTIFTTPLTGLSAAVLAFGSLNVLKTSRSLSKVIFALILMVGIYVAGMQLLFNYLPGDGWPSNFELGGTLTWIAIIALVVYHLMTQRFLDKDTSSSSLKMPNEV